jgi:biopolymer transport protein ExbD
MPFGRLERTPVAQPMSDINMTPLIDVMLVLLVIFMITAPLMTSSLKMDLPKTAGVSSNEARESLSLAITADGKWHVDDAVVARAELVKTLQARAKTSPDLDVLVRADEAVPFGQVAELIGLVQDAGLHRVGFVTRPVTPPAAAPAPAR